MKLLVNIVLLLAVSFSSLAQKKFEFGIKGGLSIVDLVDVDTPENWPFPDVQYRFSYHIGGFVRYQIYDKIDLQSGLFFSSQGGSWSVEFIEDSASADISLDRTNFVYNYLNLPLLLKYNLSEVWSIKTGPQIGLLLSADIKNQYSFVDGVQNNFDSDIKDFLNPIDLSWVLEFGYEFKSGVLIDVTYNLGLNNTVESESSSLKRKNRVFQLSLGYKF